MKIKVGCCGFAGGMEKYFEKFGLVEVQSTFYKLPRLKTVLKWREKSPQNFEFTIKCFQGITHPITSPTWRRASLKEEELKKLKDKVGFLLPTKEVFTFWKEVMEICKVLKSRICIIQLPASFKDEEKNWKNAEKFFRKIKKEIIIGVELRKWEDERRKKFCKKFEVIDVVDPFANNPQYFTKKRIAYFRLHGSPPGKRMYSYKYLRKDLEILKKKIEGLKVKEVYCLFNNIWMKEDALKFISFLFWYTKGKPVLSKRIYFGPLILAVLSAINSAIKLSDGLYTCIPGRTRIRAISSVP